MTEAGAAAGPPQVVRVKRELLAERMTCPLCNKLLNEATTISECLHTFCRKCIFEKLTEEEVDCCPICNIDLGCVPLEKLRPDHNLQDVRTKIFPLKRRKVEAIEAVSSITFPVRRKERSLSSLVVNTPRIATQRSLTGRRTRAIARRASALRRLSPIIDESTKKEEDSVEDLAENSVSPDNLIKMIQNRRQNSSNAETSNHSPNKESENCVESFLNKGELWKPLNCLVEAANRTKAIKSSSQSSVIKTERINGPAGAVHIYNSKVKEKPYKSKVQDDKNGSTPMSSVVVKARRLNAASRKRRELRTSAQALLDAKIAKRERRERRTSPIWLSLVASYDEKGDPPLPQIDASYLRIKDAGFLDRFVPLKALRVPDGDLPVSFIQRYLVKKLNLANEAEVEIKCQCQPVNPALALHNLVDLWLQLEPLKTAQASERLQASVGASAKDFVMVLTYGRKALAP